MGIINLATAEVDIHVDFDSQLATNDLKHFFSQCLHPVEQLQEIGRAIKWMFDTQYVVPDVDDMKNDDEDEEVVERLASNLAPTVEGFCKTTQPNIRRNFTTSLSQKTDLCFKAIRPDDPSILDYLNTAANQSILAEDYTLSSICILGKEHLQDFRKAAAQSEEDNEESPTGYFSTDLTSSIPGFKIIIMLFMVVFLPLLLLRLFPWGSDVKSFNNQALVNLLEGKAWEEIEKKKDKWKAERKRKHWDKWEKLMTYLRQEKERKQALKKKAKNSKLSVHVNNNGSMEDENATKMDNPNDAKVVLTPELREFQDEMQVDTDDTDNIYNNEPPSDENSLKAKNQHALHVDVLSLTVKKEEQSQAALVTEKLEGQYRYYEMRDEPYKWDPLPTEKQWRRCFTFIALDHHTPSLFSLKIFLDQKIDFSFFSQSDFANKAGEYLTTIRRFLLHTFMSCHAMLLMLFLDRLFYDETVTKLFAFRDRYQVHFEHLRYWNYFSRGRWDFALNKQELRWDVFYIIAFTYWCISIFLFSMPGSTKYCVTAMYPSEYFGFYRLLDFPPEMYKRGGIRRVYMGLLHRMGVAFRADFWQTFYRKIRSNFTKKDQNKMYVIAKGIFSLIIGILSFLPLVAIFPPLYSWHYKYWQQDVGNWKQKAHAFLYSLGILFSLIILVALLMETFSIYQDFIIFTLTALVFHFEFTLSLMGVGAGFIGFLVKLRSDAVNNYIQDRIYIEGEVKAYHEKKVDEHQKAIKAMSKKHDWDDKTEFELKDDKEKSSPKESFFAEIKCWGKEDSSSEERTKLKSSEGANTESQRKTACLLGPCAEWLCPYDPESEPSVEKEYKKIVVVPELYYWWAQMNFPCIPKELYKDLVRQLLPVGTERLKVFIKIVLMCVFVNYILTIMAVLGMNENSDSMFDMAKFVVTIFVIGVPSIAGSFQSSKVQEIKVMRKKGIIREEIERFLLRHPEFYTYQTIDEEEGISAEEAIKVIQARLDTQ